MHQETTASFQEPRPAHVPPPLLDTRSDSDKSPEKESQSGVVEDDLEVYNLPHTD